MNPHQAYRLSIDQIREPCVIQLSSNGSVGHFFLPDAIRLHCSLVHLADTKRFCNSGVISWSRLMTNKSYRSTVKPAELIEYMLPWFGSTTTFE